MSNLNILQEFERLESSLHKLLTSITQVNELLIPLEHSLRTEEFSSSGLFVPGTSNGIVCVLSSLIQGDPLSTSLESIRGSGRKFPGIVKGSDRSETKSTCDTILNIIRGRIRGSSITYVVNLRWANLPLTLDRSKTIIIGKRYYHAQNTRITKLLNQLTNKGFQILDDVGEFGGGPLTYQLVNLAQEQKDMTVLEITLPRQIAENHSRVSDVLESLTIL